MISTLYKENILDHYKNPRNFRRIKNYTHNASLENVTCGDEMKVYVELKNEHIKNIGFDARGCAISIASMSMLSEKVLGKKITEIQKIKEEDILKMLGIQKGTPRVNCVLLGLRTLRKALFS